MSSKSVVEIQKLNPRGYGNLWTFHYLLGIDILDVRQDIVSISVKVTLVAMTFLCLFMAPALAAVLCGTIYFKTSDLLRLFHEDIERIRIVGLNYNVLSKLSLNYNSLYELVHEVERELSLTTFLLLCSQWFNLNTVLLSYILGEITSISQVAGIITELISAITFIVGVILCASRISSQVSRVQTTLQLIYNKSGTLKYNHISLRCVKNMMDIKFPEMTAYGILQLNPALIASPFSSALTYGLLVLNINRS
ncbi:uncharacterized protein CDAR_126811 [Caerostris darwini]|uniref:Gustatory receptor n=1 Tax=Caerostris darwini TaxID=1538125 RepID=A0AAV4RDQ9_9ARAC|nr:uncharacterized protein CDAR_126811 [Caerostris darwini]